MGNMANHTMSVRTKLRNQRWLRRLYRLANFRGATYMFRVLPDFVIIGVQKGGTTSLYDFVIDHPKVVAAARKEVSYFSALHDLGPAWYRSQFPTRLGVRRGKLTGEATPAYIFNRKAPEHMKVLLPDIRMVVVLRNPVDRAYSQWQMNLRNGKIPSETTFEQALDIEAEAWARHPDIRIYDPADPMDLYFNSYLARGIYADQLKHWFRYYSREQFLMLATEDLLRERNHTLNRMFDFLGLEHHETTLPNTNVTTYHHHRMSHKTRSRLVEYFLPHNERLRQLTGLNPDWDR